MVVGKKSQVAIEYILLIAFIMMVTVFMTYVIGGQIVSVQKENNEKTSRNVREVIMKHVELAEIAGSGFETAFSLPLYVGGRNYSLSIEGDSILVVDFGFHDSGYAVGDDIMGNFCFNDSRTHNEIVVRNVDEIIEISSCYDCNISYQECKNAQLINSSCGTLEGWEINECQKYCLC